MEISKVERSQESGCVVEEVENETEEARNN